jgi:hypothetical protein
MATASCFVKPTAQELHIKAWGRFGYLMAGDMETTAREPDGGGSFCFALTAFPFLLVVAITNKGVRLLSFMSHLDDDSVMYRR